MTFLTGIICLVGLTVPTRADATPPPLATDGPDEIARVARSFNAMSARLAAQEAERTFMLAGISHDLRTPLAKLRLELAMVQGITPDAEAAMARQFDRLDTMLTQFLDFARGVDGEPVQEIKVAELLDGLSLPVALAGDEALMVHAPPVALARAISNLVRNAMLYGRAPIIARLTAEATMARIAIEDQGDGVPEAVLGTLARPFVRGDAARASDGGTGLGLAIAEHIASGLGGGLTLRNRVGGGFVAELAIPKGQANRWH